VLLELLHALLIILVSFGVFLGVVGVVVGWGCGVKFITLPPSQMRAISLTDKQKKACRVLFSIDLPQGFSFVVTNLLF
jgi:hypothetical protein